METVLANVTAGIISVDKTGDLTTINKSAELLLDMKPASCRAETSARCSTRTPGHRQGAAARHGPAKQDISPSR